MSHSIFATFLATLGAVATNLMQVQERATAQCTGGCDPRDLPKHLQRDIGLTEWHAFREEVAGGLDSTGLSAARWTDHVQTRQAV